MSTAGRNLHALHGEASKSTLQTRTDSHIATCNAMRWFLSDLDVRNENLFYKQCDRSATGSEVQCSERKRIWSRIASFPALTEAEPRLNACHAFWSHLSRPKTWQSLLISCLVSKFISSDLEIDVAFMPRGRFRRLFIAAVHVDRSIAGASILCLCVCVLLCPLSRRLDGECWVLLPLLGHSLIQGIFWVGGP